MRVAIISEYGIEEALLGLGLSYGLTSGYYETMPPEVKETLYNRAVKLAGKGHGHDKFLRVLTVTLDIEAPLYWWAQFDTYKIGTVAQSESKMHTLMKRPLIEQMFTSIHSEELEYLECLRQTGNFDTLLARLPMGFLQRRIVTTNYATLREIIIQRHKHKLEEWHIFCDRVWESCLYTEFLGMFSDSAINKILSLADGAAHDC